MSLVKVSLGEVIDKLSILEIKKNRITDVEKLSHVHNEYEELRRYLSDDIKDLYKKLVDINTVIWNVEDCLHRKEIEKSFDKEFINLARAAYTTNDQRFQIKNTINNLKNSELREQKGYNDKQRKPECLLLLHQGIGDMMICNGLIRHYAETHSVILGIKPQYMDNVRFMFRDLHDVEIFTAQDDPTLVQMVHTRYSHVPVVPVGFFKNSTLSVPDNFCKTFYHDAQVDFSNMYSNFFVVRDDHLEKKLYNDIVAFLGTDQYIVIHDDPSRSIVLDETLINCPAGVGKLYIGKNRCPVEGTTLFDYRLVLENALEFHGFNSNIPFMIDLCNIPVKHKFIHTYVRDTDENFVETYHKHGWKSIKKTNVSTIK
jgi:hypothetical protein